MGSSHQPPAAPSAAFLAKFATEADASGRMSFERFMQIALYDPELGYYRQTRRRVGYGGDTDFYTASTSAPLYGELVVAAARKLLPSAMAAECTFVEIGAETPDGILANVDHGFSSVRTIPVGASLDIEGTCVVFANELFDAQPFRRYVRRGGAWLELGVARQGDHLIEVECGPALSADYLPPDAPDGYVIDAPEASVRLLERIARQPWHGLLIACDYGKSWQELATAAPAGTARAYHRHTQSNDLYARPGEQDLTCHVCWDWLMDALRQQRFTHPCVESQESFFVHHAARFIAQIATREAAGLSQRKLALMQLLHPAHLGQKFQVLHASRIPEQLN